MTRIHRLRPAALGLPIALLLAACAQAPMQPSTVPGPAHPTPQAPTVSPQVAAAAETLTKWASLQDRLYHVAAPILINNAEICKGQARNLLGFTAKNRYSFGSDYAEAAQVAFGMDERLQVTNVLAGSGASKAGLKVGDGLVAAGGKPLPTGPHALSGAGAVFSPLVASQANIPFTIERGGSNRQLTIPVTRACAFAVELGNADNVNSYADGSRVLVTRGMMNFAQNDDEVAYVFAAGVAHNLLGHAGATRSAATLGSMIDNLTRVKPDESLLIGSGGIKAMPADMDAAADRIALYMLARAGYDIDGADDFWKRLTASYPATVLNGYTANHPGITARLATIQKTTAEIKAKRSARKALLP